MKTWWNGDGPECGPEWYGEDKGTNAREGCLVVMGFTAAMIMTFAILLIWD
jgi:hypothetical protein